MDRLAKADPNNAGWQRDLSVSYNKVGDVLAAQGNLTEALQSFRDGLDIAERLAKADPNNADWQRDLAISNERLGDIYMQRKETNEAKAAFERALAIYDELTARFPDDTFALVNSTVPLMRLGEL
jgi:tetratricopeptide (TPR) repeat protein